MAKKKAKTSNKPYLNDKQLRAVDAFYNKLELSKRDIELRKKDFEVLKLNKLVAEKQIGLLNERLVNAARMIKDLETSFEARMKHDKDSFLQGLAKELGIDKPIKGYDPETGEVDY